MLDPLLLLFSTLLLPLLTLCTGGKKKNRAANKKPLNTYTSFTEPPKTPPQLKSPAPPIEPKSKEAPKSRESKESKSKEGPKSRESKSKENNSRDGSKEDKEVAGPATATAVGSRPASLGQSHPTSKAGSKELAEPGIEMSKRPAREAKESREFVKDSREPLATRERAEDTSAPRPSCAATQLSAAQPAVAPLKMEPAELYWDAGAGKQMIRVVNTDAGRIAIKVKTTDNVLYSVNPVYTFLEPGQDLNLKVNRGAGAAKMDKLVISTASASPADYDVAEKFNPFSNTKDAIVPFLIKDAKPVKSQSVLR